MNIDIYVIIEPAGTPNLWSISHSAEQCWEDFRSWYQTKDDSTFAAAPEIAELQSAGYYCARISLAGVAV